MNNALEIFPIFDQKKVPSGCTPFFDIGTNS